MALARSASGPGGLSINTGAANSLFGSGNATTQAGTSGGLFGAAQASQPATTGLFGSSTATTTAPQTSSLFGSAPTNTTAATTQPAATTSLFGSAATSQPQATGGLFGAAKTTQPAQSGGLFGSLNTTTTTSQPSGGLFGSTTTTTSAPAMGSLFGNTTSAPAAGGLFGSSTTTTNQPQAGGGLFGSSNAAKPSTGLFGSTTNNQAPSTLFANAQQPQQSGGGLKLGASLNQNVVPGVKIDISNLRSTTRFNDLHESLQKDIEAIDKIIQQQANLQQECAAIMPSHHEQLSHVPTDVEFLTRKQNGMEEALSTDVAAISALRNYVTSDAENAKLSFKVIDNLKLPAQFHYHGNAAIWSEKNENGESNGQDLVSFFSTTADEMKTRLDEYKEALAQIEQHLHGVDAESQQQAQYLAGIAEGTNGSDMMMRQLELVATLREMEGSVLHIASRVGKAREGMQQVQLGGYLRPDTPGGKRKAAY